MQDETHPNRHFLSSTGLGSPVAQPQPAVAHQGVPRTTAPQIMVPPTDLQTERQFDRGGGGEDYAPNVVANAAPGAVPGAGLASQLQAFATGRGGPVMQKVGGAVRELKEAEKSSSDIRHLVASIFFGFMGLGAGLKWSQDRTKSAWALASLALVVVSAVSLYLYKRSSGDGGSTKELQTGDLEGGVGADSYTPPAARAESPVQSAEAAGEEGPRDDYGYQRQRDDLGGHEPLRPSDLMRSARKYNMDDPTLKEYMARLGGQAINQFHHVPPYYPTAPHWDHRARIDDAERIHGIGTAPNQMQRRAPYRESKIDQAGAKTSHLKEPPPGAVEPLDRVHPWMRPESSRANPTLMTSGQAVERSVAGEEGMHAVVLERLRETEELKRAQSGSDNAAESDFLRPINVSRNPPPAGEPPGGPPSEPQPGEQSPATTQDTDGLVTDDSGVETSAGFEASFSPKRQPSEGDLERYILENKR